MMYPLPWPHTHYFIWVCTDRNQLVCKCACGTTP